MPKIAAGRRDQRMHVILGSTAVIMNHMQDAACLRGEDTVVRLRELAQRPEGVGSNVVAYQRAIGRVAFHKDGAVALREVAALVAERPASRVQHEGVVAQYVAIAGGHRSHAEIVFLPVAQAENRIERAHRIERLAADVHAEADAGGQLRIRGHRGVPQRLHHRFRITAGWPRVVLAEVRQRADFGIVGERSRRADRRIRVHATCECFEPSGSHDSIGIE